MTNAIKVQKKLIRSRKAEIVPSFAAVAALCGAVDLFDAIAGTHSDAF
jgi:hypothetical protein